MKKGKGKVSFGEAFGAALEALSKTVAASEQNKKALGLKAVLANAPALIDSIVKADNADIALMSTMVKAATVFKSEPSANAEVFNNTIQRYLFVKAKDKKTKKLIKANME